MQEAESKTKEPTEQRKTEARKERIARKETGKQKLKGTEGKELKKRS